MPTKLITFYELSVYVIVRCMLYIVLDWLLSRQAVLLDVGRTIGVRGREPAPFAADVLRYLMRKICCFEAVICVRCNRASPYRSFHRDSVIEL